LQLLLVDRVRYLREGERRVPKREAQAVGHKATAIAAEFQAVGAAATAFRRTVALTIWDLRVAPAVSAGNDLGAIRTRRRRRRGTPARPNILEAARRSRARIVDDLPALPTAASLSRARIAPIGGRAARFIERAHAVRGTGAQSLVERLALRGGAGQA
jgi:hypothetical protein